MTLGCAPPSDAVVPPAIHPPTPALTRVASPPAPANCQLPAAACWRWRALRCTATPRSKSTGRAVSALSASLASCWQGGCHFVTAVQAWRAVHGTPCCWWWHGCPWFVHQLTCPAACHLTPTPPTSPRPSCSGAARHLPHSLRHRQRGRACTSQGRGGGGAPPRRQRQRHHAAPTCVALLCCPLAC